jgi:uncharacterized protein (TIGR02001 family)
VRLLPVLVFALSWATPAGAAELSGDVGLVSDYRYRGVSLSDGRPAVQASVTLEHSGFYATAWSSTLGGRLADSEIDLTAGYERELAPWMSLEVSTTHYAYPSSPGDGYSEAAAAMTVTRGPASAALTFSYAPPQRPLRDETGRARDNSYVSASGDYAVPNTPIALKAALGYERGAFDEVRHGGKLDWSLGAELVRGPARLGLGYVGSNADAGNRHALVGELHFSW